MLRFSSHHTDRFAISENQSFLKPIKPNQAFGVHQLPRPSRSRDIHHRTRDGPPPRQRSPGRPSAYSTWKCLQQHKHKGNQVFAPTLNSIYSN